VVTVVAAVAVVVAAVVARLRYARPVVQAAVCRKLTIGTGEGVAARHQARPSRKGRQDQEHGGDVRWPGMD